ncbi:MAG: hypothetical protein WEB60_10320 [Terrimicrobiaceae bacterium]
MSHHEVLNTPKDEIHYREYKIILQAQRFQTAQAFKDFWNIVVSTAKKCDVKVVEAPAAFDNHVREVLFYDTEDFALYNNHFIVRLRTFYKDGWSAGVPELTVKFRHPDLETAAAVDVKPATPGGAARIKFKEELLPLKESLGGIRSMFSHNCVLAMPREGLDLVASDLISSFPGLKPAIADSGAKVILVNDFAVEEVQVDVGELHFGGGLKGKTSISVWRDRKHERPLCGEFAFQCRFESTNDLHKANLDRAEKFYKTLQLDAFEWVSLGTTKTAIVYHLGPRASTNRE